MFNNELWQKPASGAAGGNFYTHQIAKSFRWDSGYLKWTPGSAGNRQVWTFSCWVKKAIQPGNTDVMLLNAGTSGGQSSRFRAYWYGDLLRSSSADANYNVSSGVYRDPSAWMHIVWKLTGGTSYQYVNGVEVSTSSVSGDVAINNNVEHTLGIAGDYGTGGRFKGYIAEVVFIDGTAHDPDDFAETKNGVWIPKDPSGLTFGSQGYYLDFADASAPGNDVSGNNNDWTNVDLATHDQMLDTPTFDSSSNGGNFATIGGLEKNTGGFTFSEGNLKYAVSTNQRGFIFSQGVPESGKYYWEVRVTQFGGTQDHVFIGVCEPDKMRGNLTGSRGGAQVSGAGGYTVDNYHGAAVLDGSTQSGDSIGTARSVPQTFGIAIDRDNNTFKWTYDGSTYSSTYTIPSSGVLAPYIGSGGGSNTASGVFNFGADSTFAGLISAGGNADGNGYGNFSLAVPSGYVALCAANLPVADAVDPAQTDDDYPQKLFSPLLYTGNGGTNNITGLGFKPDLVWIKIRNTASNGPLVDSSRGTNKILFSQITDAEVTSANLTAFGTDGFSLAGGLASYDANFNGNTNTYASWNWRANGGTTSSNTDGTITTTLQVNSATGFSIGTYTGSGSNATVGHGLGARPDWSIFRERGTAGNWIVTFQPVMGSNDHNLYLQTHIAESDGNYFQDTAMTSSVISIGTHADINGSSNTYVMYNFINVEGFSKFGKYAANGDADGAFIYTGFRPAYVMIKGLDVGAEWTVYDDKRDPFNEADHILQMDIHDAERTDLDEINILSNGFKCLSNGGRTNQSGKNYVYAAFANNPFKYATAR